MGSTFIFFRNVRFEVFIFSHQTPPERVRALCETGGGGYHGISFPPQPPVGVPGRNYILSNQYETWPFARAIRPNSRNRYTLLFETVIWRETNRGPRVLREHLTGGVKVSI